MGKGHTDLQLDKEDQKTKDKPLALNGLYTACMVSPGWHYLLEVEQPFHTVYSFTGL